MEIQFSRSGGFAGMATMVEGRVVFAEAGATVTSAGSRYRRVLEPDEASLLVRTLKEAAPLPSSPGPGMLRDAFQYDVSVTTEEGGTARRVPHGGAPDTEALMRWVQEECRRIWDFRIQQAGK